MSELIKITSKDGFVLDAYKAVPTGAVKGAVLVIQEIFGVNSHIRAVADGYANAGYVAIAPAIFDRVEQNVELDYNEAGVSAGADIAFNKLDMSETLADLAATVGQLSEYGKVGVVGYCFGGLLAYLAACNTDGIACSVGYYGGGIVGFLDQKPKVPLMLHFGELDSHIPLSDVDQIKATLPQIPVHVYKNADHGFNCDLRESFNEDAARLALDKTLLFFAEHIG